MLRVLENEGICYAVITSVRESDRDILSVAVGAEDLGKIAPAIVALGQNHFAPVQYSLAESGGHFLHLIHFDSGRLRNVVLHIFCGYSWRAALVLAPEILLADRSRRASGIWVAAEAAQLIFLCVKRFTHGVTNEENGLLRELLSNLCSQRANELLIPWFGVGLPEEVVALVSICKNVRSFVRRRLWLRGWTAKPTYPLSAAIKVCCRLFRNIMRPRTFTIIMLGPDGAGKSTLRKNITESLSSAFSIRPMWYRPRLIGRSGAGRPAHEPHSLSARSKIASALYLAMVFCDCWIGYFRHSLPPYQRRLLIYDRYFYDILVDPVRYRYSGPMWAVRFLSRLVPHRKFLLFVLDADEHSIYSRKQELSIEELRRQRLAFRQLGLAMRKTVFINTDNRIVDCTNDAWRSICVYLSANFKQDATLTY